MANPTPKQEIVVPVVVGTVGAAEAKTTHSVLDSSFPVLVPDLEELHMSEDNFRAAVSKLRSNSREAPGGETETETETDPNPEKEIDGAATEDVMDPSTRSAFMDALHQSDGVVDTSAILAAQNKMLTANSDVAFISANSPFVDIFYAMKGQHVSLEVMEHLHEAWKIDPLLTLKLIFNARSIHLGKSERYTAYNALGWLYEHHPQTLITNLQWLVRPVIEKSPAKQKKGEGKEQAAKQDGEDDDLVLLDEEGGEVSDPAAFDVKDGGAHGYWKDLLNIVALAAEDLLLWDATPREMFNDDSRKRRNQGKLWDHDQAKAIRQEKQAEVHEAVVKKLQDHAHFRLLYVAVARLFADQLRLDLQRLQSRDKEEIRKISLAAKWAPSSRGAHDRLIFIVSSIAELLYPLSTISPDSTMDRETYLKHAREAYRKTTLSPLRKHLEIVERDLSAKTYANIRYDRLPSIAMNRYAAVFSKRDPERFGAYLHEVASGTAKISGAVLTPGKLVSQVGGLSTATRKRPSLIELATLRQVADGQWPPLVRRVRESGTLRSSIAVCDVSGSMTYPKFQDGTSPLDHAVGLSLLLSDIVAPPFGGSIITFSEAPQVLKVGGPGDKRTLSEKVEYLKASDWGYSTNFVSVFEKLILPIAVENKLSQEDMVKQVFVFSDMQFNEAESGREAWTTSYERIKKLYAKAGYELPTLVFWNLGGENRSGKPRPVTKEDAGTVLMSGYSQAMMKVFLDGGGFEDEEDEDQVVEEVVKGEDGEDVVQVKKVVAQPDPLKVVKKALNHKAYSMLKVVD